MANPMFGMVVFLSSISEYHEFKSPLVLVKVKLKVIKPFSVKESQKFVKSNPQGRMLRQSESSNV